MRAESCTGCHGARTALGVLCFGLLALSARSDEVRLGSIVRASGAEENILYPWAHADPADANHLMVCGSRSYPNKKILHAFVYASADSGATWQRTLLDDSTRWVTEASCTYGQDGHAYFADGESDTTSGEPRHEWGHLQLFESNDQGMTWGRAGRRAGGFVDWTFLAAIPGTQERPPALVIFGNAAADSRGHWVKSGPVTLTATDGARTLTTPTAPRKGLAGTFAGGSVVLPNGTALFLAGSQGERPAAADADLRLFAVSPTDRKLRTRAILRSGQHRYVSVDPALVQDASGGRHRGRLYAAWSESGTEGAGELWLAVSDDDGYHWSSRAILPLPATRVRACSSDWTLPSIVKIAVNREGTLGVLWSNDRRTVSFSSSSDGGARFRPSQTVAQHEDGTLTADDSIAANEWLLAEAIAARKGHSLDQFVDLSHLGLSIRMSQPEGVENVMLAADASGTFHAFWTGLDALGMRALLTRTIAVTGSEPGIEPVLAKSAAGATCTESGEALQAAMPSRLPRLSLAGYRDVSSEFYLRIDHFNYEAATRIVTAEIVLINKRAHVQKGELSLFGLGVHSDYGVPVALNASGVRHGQPFWDLASAIPAEGLPAKSVSAPIK